MAFDIKDFLGSQFTDSRNDLYHSERICYSDKVKIGNWLERRAWNDENLLCRKRASYEIDCQNFMFRLSGESYKIWEDFCANHKKLSGNILIPPGKLDEPKVSIYDYIYNRKKLISVWLHPLWRPWPHTNYGLKQKLEEKWRKQELGCFHGTDKCNCGNSKLPEKSDQISDVDWCQFAPMFHDFEIKKKSYYDPMNWKDEWHSLFRAISDATKTECTKDKLEETKDAETSSVSSSVNEYPFCPQNTEDTSYQSPS